MEYKVGLVIGRFQPFHKGHEYLIEKSLEFAEQIIIGIGSSNVINHDNPYDYDTRKKLITRFITQDRFKGRVIKVFPIPDLFDDKGEFTSESDEQWLQYTLKKAGKFDIVIGNNDWVNNLFQAAGYKVLIIDYFKRRVYEGKKIRNLMRKGKLWKHRIPESLRGHI